MTKQYLKQLDYTLTTAEERIELLHTLLSDASNLEANFENYKVKKILEYMGNFVLFAIRDEIKDEVQLDTKNNTFKKKKEESLDEKMDDPLFDKTKFQEVKRNMYTKPKDPITLQDRADLAELDELMAAIEFFQAYLTLQNSLSVPEMVKPLSNYERYKLKHFIIDLQREQYVIRDTLKPKIDPYISHHYVPDHHELDYWFDTEDRKWAIDLTNSEHVYLLLKHYSILREESYENLNGDLKYILFDLETVVDRVELSPDRYHILIRKVDKATNNVIGRELREQFGKSYDGNYISRIWRHEICQKIADEAKQLYLEFECRDVPQMWKVCPKCGRKLFKSDRFFSINDRIYGGLELYCKKCEKKI